MSLSASDISSTGEVDSISISYDDVITINKKLIELDYNIQLIDEYENLMFEDSILIDKYRDKVNNLTKENNKIKRNNKTLIAVSIGSILAAILGIMF